VVETLGTVGGAQAATLARQAWTSDSSSAVRAAAVVAIAQTDSAGRRPLLLQALLTPSYRDEIQNSAYRAIARSGDTTMVDSVNAHAGDHHFAPHVLAALASRGSTRALDLLAKPLNDDRPFVRGWALEAFQFTLRRELAQPALHAARAGLKFADTQKAVDELMQQWSKAGGK
jgi:HEAT repeat protein